MKPTDEQLRDPKWWDENTPEGATHYNGGLANPWLKESPASYFTEYSGWLAYISESNAIMHFSNATPRPTKPAAPEWDGKGLPPVGCEVELSHSVRVCFEDREVVADIPEGTEVEINGKADFGHGEVRIFSGAIDGAWFTGYHKEFAFRPLRTKEQRERDELEYLMRGDSEFFIPDWIRLKVADAIIAAGWHKGDS